MSAKRYFSGWSTSTGKSYVYDSRTGRSEDYDDDKLAHYTACERNRRPYASRSETDREAQRQTEHARGSEDEY